MTMHEQAPATRRGRFEPAPDAPLWDGLADATSSTYPESPPFGLDHEEYETADATTCRVYDVEPTPGDPRAQVTDRHGDEVGRAHGSNGGTPSEPPTGAEAVSGP